MYFDYLSLGKNSFESMKLLSFILPVKLCSLRSNLNENLAEYTVIWGKVNSQYYR